MIDHNERAAEARALRQAAVDARSMHDPVASDCEEWAAWLDARAERVEQAVSSGTTPPDSPEANARARAEGHAIALPSVQPPTREQIATVYASAVSSQLSPGEFVDALDVLGVETSEPALFQQPTPSAGPCPDCGEHALNQKGNCVSCDYRVPDPEPPSIDDMAPGTVFVGDAPSGPRPFRIPARAFVEDLRTGKWWAVRQINPSTIRDVTPPAL